MIATTRIDIVFTNPARCELDKPRVLLGDRAFKWMHWRADLKRYVPCLRDYNQECKPCGLQGEFCYLAAAILEKERGQTGSIDRRAAWAGLTEEERECRRVAQRQRWRGYSPEWIEDACVSAMGGPSVVIAGEKWVPVRPIIQCVPALAMNSLDADNLRGLVVFVRVDRSKRVTLARQPYQVETPDDFPVEPQFMLRYGIRNHQPQPQDRPAILPFRRAN